VIVLSEAEAWSPLEQFLEELQREKSLRTETLGPIAAAVGVVRESCATMRLVLNELESSTAFHLELLDALLRQRFGSRWWDEVTQDAEDSGEVS
jgi:signal transduction histidine kinase